MAKARGTGETGAGPLFEEAGLAETEPVSAPAPVPSRKAVGWFPVAMVSAVVGLGLWGAWVTKNVIDAENMPPMARVQLSSIVGEYVQAQARSSSTPEQVTAETRAFMAEIERNLRLRGQKGQVVFVGEAVLTQNVPDITVELRREIYKKVKMPQQAAAANDVMGAMRSAMTDPSALPIAGGNGGPAN